MLYIVKRQDELYVTEDKATASRLSKESYRTIKELALTDIVAHFAIEVPEKKIRFVPHTSFKGAYKVSDPKALENYVNESEKILNLDAFNPRRATWEDQRLSNLKKLEELVAERKSRKN